MWNSYNTLDRSIGSVLGLDYPQSKLEIIIVDDGSTDDSVKQAESILGASKIHWQIQSISNHGPSTARNLGWRLAKADWIQFLDADDELHPVKLKVQCDLISQCSQSTAVIYSPWQRRSELDSNVQPLNFPDLSEPTLHKLITSDGFLMTGCQLYRKSWLESVDGYDETKNCIEDVDLDIRINMAGGQFMAANYHQALAYYHDQPNSLSQQNLDTFISGCVDNAEKIEKFWQATGTQLNHEQRQSLLDVYQQANIFFAAINRQEYSRLKQKILTLGAKLEISGRLPCLMRPFMGHRLAEKYAAQIRQFKN